MAPSDFNIGLISRPEGERVWAVRATRGEYFRHFIENGIAAIGHLDPLKLATAASQSKKQALDLAKIGSALQRATDFKKATISSHISQVRMFCDEMRPGDLVVTLNSRQVCVGRCVGHAYFDSAPLFLEKTSRNKRPLIYQLRRPVSWGPVLSRANLSQPLERVFFSHRSVFEITQLWDFVYHMLFPAFQDGDRLYISLNIKRNADIPSRDVASLLAILRDFERVAAQLSNSPFDESLTVQAGFFSKGVVWPKYLAKDPKKALIIAAMITLLLTGGKFSAGKLELELNGLLNKETIAAISNAVKDISKKHGADETLKNLELDAPEEPAGKLIPPKKPINDQTILIA